ncbi:hypothetical protein [Variovorax sp. PAMC26660]|uniref:hypothetical protein n=1 Tax=Variovorax sp. PAMC26660 TaxID=2762322 RepID=UPI001C9BABD4|nr:hypothetical protein [Variovorax sp. PAMC26660]
MRDLLIEAKARRATLHHVFGANLFIAHAVDYVYAIRNAYGITENRRDFVREFDGLFSVGGSRLGDRKFELIDAINNALKHIRLDPKRYRDVEGRYGPISFQSLFEQDGRVLCLLDGYRFDYVSAVLAPAGRALTDWDFEDDAQIRRFARGDGDFVVDYYGAEDALMESNEPADAIDQMIAACNPRCSHCGEGEEDCVCAEYVFAGEQGEFEPRFRADFDFDAVMSRISGAYSPRN